MSGWHCYTCERSLDLMAMTYHCRLGHSVGDTEEYLPPDPPTGERVSPFTDADRLSAHGLGVLIEA